MNVGSTIFAHGYITKALFLRGQPAAEIERRIGYRMSRLAQGWHLLFLLEMPKADDFQFRGYSHISGGVVQGHLAASAGRPNIEQQMAAEGRDLLRDKQRVVANEFRLNGPDRLVKVIPVEGAFGERDYPTGSGIPQWELMRDLPFRVAALIGPGEMYMGYYT